MLGKRSSDQQRVIDQLRTLLPELELTLAVRLAASDAVQECSRSGSTLSGIVRGDDRSSRSVSLSILSNGEIIPSCSCRAQDETSNLWCEHAAALVLRSVALGFFAPRAGFAVKSQLGASWIEDFSAVMGELVAIPENSEIPLTSESEILTFDKVKIELHSNSNRLGVQVYFDGGLQSPSIIDDLRPRAKRTLANVFVDLLQERASWDQEILCWYIDSQSSIETVIGLLSEFPEVVEKVSGKNVRSDPRVLNSKVLVEWQASGALATLSWYLKDSHTKTDLKSATEDFFDGQQEISPPITVFGTEPAYAVHEGAILRLSQPASALVALFARSNSQILPNSSVGPLLEILSSNENPWLKEINPEKRPESVIATPKVELNFEASGIETDHFSTTRQLELRAKLVFDYKEFEKNQVGVVFRPDFQFELATRKILEDLGFAKTNSSQAQHTQSYSAFDRIALNVLNASYSVFPDHWKITALEEIKKQLKFGDLQLQLNLGLAGAGGVDDKSEPSGKEFIPCEIKLILNGSVIPISTLFKSPVPDENSWFRFENGTYCRIPGGNIGHLKSILSAVDSNFRLSNTIKKDISTAQALWLSRIQSSGLDVTAAKGLKKLADKLSSFQGLKALKLSPAFKGSLRDYQHEALSWLNFLREFELGGILADEMGLGKTVQTLALLDYFRSKGLNKGKPTLVVAPTSVLMNWYYESAKFTPKLKTLVLHGPSRSELYENLDQYDLVITSYALLRLNKHELEQWRFFYLILDEAQYIKNYQAATTAAAKGLRSEHRLALTGTPTENRPSELWSIMDFVMPGYMGPLESFKTMIERPMMDGTATTEGLDLLRVRTRPFILRRTKNQVERELPPKVETVLPVDMTESQSQLYNQILEEVKPKVFRAVEAKGLKGATISILAALLRLRQVCNHPNSIEPLKHVPGYSSGKFNALKELLDELQAAERKTLIFCQFREMLSIIKEHLDQQSLRYLYMDGSTKNRHDLIESFNHNPDVRVFLISLKAGGFGINLTAADSVVIYDPWWNPAVENQAIDRAHRIGQHKTVHVYRLLTQNTVEERIMDLKSKKASLANALLDNRKAESLQLTKMDLENLFAPLPQL